MPVSLNGSFRIETADINKDGTDDIYGFKEDWFNPWIDCKKQVSAMYFNQENCLFQFWLTEIIFLYIGFQ